MRFLCGLLLAVAACGGDDGGDLPPPRMVGACSATETYVPLDPGIHVEVGTPITWRSNPPTSGKHYPAWAGWDRQYDALDRGYWVHNAEHGGVVLLYRCDDGCPALVDQLVEVARTAPVESLCAAPVRNRVLVVADALLPDGVQVAASAWGVMYTASCFDDSLRAFVAEHMGHGPENLCGDGTGAGGTFIDP